MFLAAGLIGPGLAGFFDNDSGAVVAVRLTIKQSLGVLGWSAAKQLVAVLGVHTTSLDQFQMDRKGHNQFGGGKGFSPVSANKAGVGNFDTVVG